MQFDSSLAKLGKLKIDVSYLQYTNESYATLLLTWVFSGMRSIHFNYLIALRIMIFSDFRKTFLTPSRAVVCFRRSWFFKIFDWCLGSNLFEKFFDKSNHISLKYCRCSVFNYHVFCRMRSTWKRCVKYLLGKRF